MKRPRASIRLRLTSLFAALFLIAGAVLLAVNYGLVSARLPDDDLIFQTNVPPEFAASVVDPLVLGSDAVIVNGVPISGLSIEELPDEVRDQLDDGLPLFDPQGEPPLDLSPGMVDLSPGMVVDGGFFVMAGDPVPAATVAALPTQTRDRALRELLTQSMLALAAMAVVSVGLGWWMSGRVLRPLHRITATAQRLGEQDLHERIALDGPADELKHLADTFDAMLGRLDAAFQSQRRFAANASHQLRTPLAIMRTEVDVTLDDPDATVEDFRAMAERVRQATERSEDLVSSLLLLARSERALERHEPADLAAAAEVAAASLRSLAIGEQVEVTLMCDPAPVVGDPALLDDAVVNLIDNAVLHNNASGWVHVATGVLDGRAFVRVANSGPVVDPEQVEGLFEPFRRAAERTGDRPGSGLGLSIVRSVAHAHGGSVVGRAFANGGLEVTLSIPTAGYESPHDVG